MQNVTSHFENASQSSLTLLEIGNYLNMYIGFLCARVTSTFKNFPFKAQQTTYKMLGRLSTPYKPFLP